MLNGIIVLNDPVNAVDPDGLDGDGGDSSSGDGSGDPEITYDENGMPWITITEPTITADYFGSLHTELLFNGIDWSTVEIRRAEIPLNGMLGSYSRLRALAAGSGLRVHHLIEKRFASVYASLESIILSKTDHQVFTNAWRALIPYGEGTRGATSEQVMNAAKKIYTGYPEILERLGL